MDAFYNVITSHLCFLIETIVRDERLLFLYLAPVYREY